MTRDTAGVSHGATRALTDAKGISNAKQSRNDHVRGSRWLVMREAGAQPGASDGPRDRDAGPSPGEQQFEPGTLGRYDAKKTADEIVGSVPLICRYADISL
jgi:hypothetical protein